MRLLILLTWPIQRSAYCLILLLQYGVVSEHTGQTSHVTHKIALIGSRPVHRPPVTDVIFRSRGLIVFRGNSAFPNLRIKYITSFSQIPSIIKLDYPFRLGTCEHYTSILVHTCRIISVFWCFRQTLDLYLRVDKSHT